MQLHHWHVAASSSPIYGGGPRRGTPSTYIAGQRAPIIKNPGKPGFFIVLKTVSCVA